MKRLALLTLLSACALHSESPTFSDAEARLALGTAPLTLTDGTTQLNLTPEGQHYRATGDGQDQIYTFVPLPGQGYVAQITGAKGTDYALATWDGQSLLTRPLDCSRLKTDLRTNALVQMANNACRLYPGVDPVAAFSVMAETAPAPTRRLTRP